MAARGGQTIYSATYSNVPVYEFNIAGNHVMRRRSDDWINATHILKVADYDKPARTRILEREVQKGVHEKVQGGYGKYQGTWIPLADGKELAAKNGVLDKLMPIFTFVPGDRSPPPAPKHETAASGKPRAPRAPPQRKAPPAPIYQHAQDYEQLDVHDGGSGDEETAVSESQFDEYEMAQQYTGGLRKRRRIEDQMSQADRDHQLWATELLDYFMFQDDPEDSIPSPPIPPANANLDRPIDDKGHTALHWAAAIGDVEVVKDLIRRGANVEAQSKAGATPLMRSAIFTNCFDKRNMDKIAGLLIRTVNMQDWTGSTVFHLIAQITQSKKKYECARYYMDCILNKMAEVLSPDQVEHILNEVDREGDTAITIAARNGARKCVRSLIGRNAAVGITNKHGETADQLIVQLNHRRQERTRQLSSSPFQADLPTSTMGGAVQPPNGSILFDPLVPHSSLAANGAASSALNGAATAEVFRSEAALALTTSVLPTVITKGRSMASAMDSQIAEKDAELVEAQRVAAMRKAEIDALRRQAEEYRVREMEQTAGGIETDEQLLRELEELTRECESLTEEEDRFALTELIKAEESRLDSAMANGDVDGDVDMSPSHDGTPDEQFVRRKLDLARQLADLYKERRQLIRTIVQNVAGASMHGAAEDRHHLYKRLITGALNVREEDVEEMLPEIVAELEERREMME